MTISDPVIDLPDSDSNMNLNNTWNKVKLPEMYRNVVSPMTKNSSYF